MNQEEQTEAIGNTVYYELAFDVPINQTFTYRSDEKRKAAPGKRAMAPFGRRELLGFIVAEHSKLPEQLDEAAVKPVRRVVDAEALFGTKEIELARWMSTFYFCGIGEALACMIPSGRKESSLSSIADDELIPDASIQLSEEQKQAIHRILDSKDPYHYVYGITGSGKTEVFLRLADEMIARNKSVIYLVPEISLSHQVEELITKRFGPIAVTVHSGMSPSARLAAWTRIRRGETRIVVGPRSAIFAPLQNLGLIIIDEEHDGSYKSGTSPRYHARQVAFKRCSIDSALLVMGSATPSVESWHLMEQGKLHKLVLSKRLSGGAEPEIIPVNLETSESCLSDMLKEEIRQTARMGRQTILFLNRRGFSYFYHCKQCSYELRCKNCSVSLTYHKSSGRAVCHYCGYSVIPPTHCPQCGSMEAGYSGFGTEMIEEEVRRSFPDLRILRADADSTSKKGSLKETLDQFKSGTVDILLGTQMVAKGLNFPGVRLVGVVLADTALNLPDFRSAERTFSLIVQVAGRAGRYFPDGKVIVQSFRPQDPAIMRACTMDIPGFYESELAQRELLGFPPFSRLIRFTMRSKNATKADNAMHRLFIILEPMITQDMELLGPAECPIGIIAGNHRRQLIVRGQNMNTLHALVSRALKEYHKSKDAMVYLEVDVDPVSLL